VTDDIVRSMPEHGSSLMTLVMGAYFFFIGLILAHLEIQIEGPHGWPRSYLPGAGTTRHPPLVRKQ